MTKTALLPTLTAVRIVWGMTGKFSTDISKDIAKDVEEALKNIQEKAASSSDNERSYVMSAAATMKASLRNLDIAYKGRELNFKENETLRTEYLNSIKENMDIGSRAQDFTKSLPQMAIGGAGSMTLAQALGLSGLTLWGVGIIFAASGFLIKMEFERNAARKTEMLYVTEDYERDKYYDQYINRARDLLYSLFLDLERIHRNVFLENYENNITDRKLIDNILAGVTMTCCEFVNKHMMENKITPELWSKCESGNQEVVKLCPHYEKTGFGVVSLKK